VYDYIEIDITNPIVGFSHTCPLCLIGTVSYRGSTIDDDVYYAYPWHCSNCNTYWTAEQLIAAVTYMELEDAETYTQAENP
jgi:hypothetical protein